MKIEYWVKNASDNDLGSSELNVRIPAGKLVNLCALNPNLTHEVLQKSEESGFLSKCYSAAGRKLIKLQFAPKIQQYSTFSPTDAVAPIPSRVKSSVVMDVKEQDFIEELSHFEEDLAGERYSDGFIENLDEVGPQLTESESGQLFNGEKFSAVTMPPREEPEREPEVGVKTKITKRKYKNSREFVVEPVE